MGLNFGMEVKEEFKDKEGKSKDGLFIYYDQSPIEPGLFRRGVGQGHKNPRRNRSCPYEVANVDSGGGSSAVQGWRHYVPKK